MSKLKVMVKKYHSNSLYHSIFVQQKFLFFRYWSRVTVAKRTMRFVDRDYPLLFNNFDDAVALAKTFQDPTVYAKFVLEQNELYAKYITDLNAQVDESNRVFVSE